MSRTFEHLERRVERGMSLLAGDRPSPPAGALDRVRRAMLAESHALRGGASLWRPARRWLTAAALLLAVGLSWQFAALPAAAPAAGDAATLTDWAIAMDHATHVVVSLHEDPWLPEDLPDAREDDADRSLDEAWESFERAFDLGA